MAYDNIDETIVRQAFPEKILELGREVPLPPKTDADPVYSTASYDNRAELSRLSSLLGAKLDGFAQTLATTFFFSQAFSWLTMTAQTDNPDVVLATAYETAEENLWRIGVDETAEGDFHRTYPLFSDKRTEFETGTYGFDLTLDGDIFGIEFSIENEDTDPLTNHELLVKLKNAFGSTGAQIDAGVDQAFEKVYSLDYDPYGLEPVSALSLVSSKTGEDQSFSLKDTTGELVGRLGLDRTLGHPENSRYTLNGDEFEFYANTIALDGDGVQAVLTGTSGPEGEGRARIRTKYGFSAVADSITSVIEAYNTLIQWIDDNQYFISPSLKQALFENLDADLPLAHDKPDKETPDILVQGKPAISKIPEPLFPRLARDNTLESGLAGIGLSLNPDGTLDVETKFHSNFKSRYNDIYEILSGERGFFTRIRGALEKIQAMDGAPYVYSRNHVLVYSRDAGAQARKIYQKNVSSLINTFA